MGLWGLSDDCWPLAAERLNAFLAGRPLTSASDSLRNSVLQRIAFEQPRGPRPAVERAGQTCWQLHPGLCRTRDSAVRQAVLEGSRQLELFLDSLGVGLAANHALPADALTAAGPDGAVRVGPSCALVAVRRKQPKISVFGLLRLEFPAGAEHGDLAKPAASAHLVGTGACLEWITTHAWVRQLLLGAGALDAADVCLTATAPQVTFLVQKGCRVALCLGPWGMVVPHKLCQYLPDATRARRALVRCARDPRAGARCASSLGTWTASPSHGARTPP